MALRTNQLAFLAKRIEPGIQTDKQAAEACKLAIGTVWNWKSREPEFKAAYMRLFEEPLEFAMQAGKDLQALSYRARYRALTSVDRRLAFRAAQDTDDRWGQPKTQEVGVHWSPEIAGLMEEYERLGEEGTKAEEAGGNGSG